MAKEYHKIETLFERDMEGNKKLIEGKFRDPLVRYIQDCEWTFTEKIDGTNIRVIWDGHKVAFGGRTDNAQLPVDLINRLQELFSGDVNEELFEQTFDDKQVILYGEGYGAGIQKGDSYSQTKEFILFDIEVGNVFLERVDVEGIAKIFNIKCVPIMLIGTIKEAVDFVKSKPKSILAKEDLIIEGIVGTPNVRICDWRGNRIIVKIKVKDFEK